MGATEPTLRPSQRLVKLRMPGREGGRALRSELAGLLEHLSSGGGTSTPFARSINRGQAQRGVSPPDV